MIAVRLVRPGLGALAGARRLMVLCLVCLTLACGGCGVDATPPSAPVAPTPTSEPPTPVPELAAVPQEEEEGGQTMPFELTSTGFAHEESIPSKYTCDGEDVSPSLQWGDPPPGTQSFALIMDDPDAPAGTWVHWVLYGLPAQARTLPVGVVPDAELADGGRHGKNSWGRSGYGGPCPPSGTHRYFFKLYALDTMLDLDPGASKEQLLQAMEGHIVAQAELMGMYSRK
jgi:Raf kinase inhibitor-like YbhB/YbcL family protein